MYNHAHWYIKYKQIDYVLTKHTFINGLLYAGCKTLKEVRTYECCVF